MLYNLLESTSSMVKLLHCGRGGVQGRSGNCFFPAVKTNNHQVGHGSSIECSVCITLSSLSPSLSLYLSFHFVCLQLQTHMGWGSAVPSGSFHFRILLFFYPLFRMKPQVFCLLCMYTCVSSCPAAENTDMDCNCQVSFYCFTSVFFSEVCISFDCTHKIFHNWYVDGEVCGRGYGRWTMLLSRGLLAIGCILA